MKFLLTFLFAVSAYAGDLKIVTTPAKSYTGSISTSIIKDGAKTIATAKTVARPIYAGGGTVTTVKEVQGKTFTVITVPSKLPGGGNISTVKK